jgi:hypothetical protein
MKEVGEPEARHAWRGALIAAILNVVCMPIDLLLGRDVADMPRWPSLLSAGVGLVLIVVLVIRRHAPASRLPSWAFLINTAAIAFALWCTSHAYARAPGWLPFQANKLGALAAPLLAPSLATGLISIIAYVGGPLLEMHFLPDSVQRHLPLGERWSLVAYGLFAVALLIHRLLRITFERRLVRAQSEAAAAQKLARTLLAVRDFANTPIQTLELGTELIRQAHPELRPLLDRLDRSIARLMELNRLLLSYERHLRWSPGDESLDSGHLLGRAR